MLFNLLPPLSVPPTPKARTELDVPPNSEAPGLKSPKSEAPPVVSIVMYSTVSEVPPLE